MSDELARLADRNRQNRAARAAALGDRMGGASSSAARPGPQFQPGDRVFDIVSGLDGEVLGRTVENIILPTAE